MQESGKRRPPSGTLVASYCFPPYSDTAGIVVAKRVLLAGEPVDVISNAMDKLRRRDLTLTRIGGQFVRRYAALQTPSGFSSWRSIADYAKEGFATFERWQHARGPYARVFSRAQFTASHYLGATIKAAQPEIEWVAEFSDPLSHNVLGATRSAPLEDPDQIELWSERLISVGYSPPAGNNLLEWCEVITFAFADEIMFTNSAQRDFMLHHCHDSRLAERARGRSLVSPHPTLPREFYSNVESDYELPTDKVNIGYFGNFYANRGVGLVLDAVAQLPSRFRRPLLFHVFTSNPDELSALVESKLVDDCFRVNPYRDYLEFLNLTDRMDVLLINDAVSPPGGVNPFLPSKWSDYRGSTTPVWGIIEEGSPLDAVEGITYRTPVEHVSGIQATLAHIVADAKLTPRLATKG